MEEANHGRQKDTENARKNKVRHNAVLGNDGYKGIMQYPGIFTAVRSSYYCKNSEHKPGIQNEKFIGQH